MRLIVGAAFAALILAGTAAAQDTPTPAAPPPGPPAESACAAIVAPPALPDGAAASAQQMRDGNTAFNTWIEAANAALECRREEAQAAINRANSLSEQFNAGGRTINTARAAWVADVTEFNEHNPQGRGR